MLHLQDFEERSQRRYRGLYFLRVNIFVAIKTFNSAISSAVHVPPHRLMTHGVFGEELFCLIDDSVGTVTVPLPLSSFCLPRVQFRFLYHTLQCLCPPERTTRHRDSVVVPSVCVHCGDMDDTVNVNIENDFDLGSLSRMRAEYLRVQKCPTFCYPMQFRVPLEKFVHTQFSGYLSR